MIKVNTKDTRTTSISSCVSIVNFEQVNAGWGVACTDLHDGKFFGCIARKSIAFCDTVHETFRIFGTMQMRPS